MSHFVLCPSCKRHVRPAETSCPFCSSALPDELRNADALPRPPSGLSRARAYAFRAAIVASVAGVGAACGSDDESPGPGDGSAGTTSTGGSGGTTSTGGSSGSATGGSSGDDAGSGGTAGTASGGTTGSGGFSGTPPMPYGTVWPDPDAVVHV